jgi:hypothetical protein
LKKVSKDDLVRYIAVKIGIPAPKMSTGSTEPREIFDAVDEALGLRLQHGGRRTKTELARGIVEAAGFPWLADYESHGGTVTKKGLLATKSAIDLFLGV